MKRLPLAPPQISSYLFHAYPLSILAQENHYLPWFYNTHIQLFSFPNEELKFYNHPYSTYHEIRHLYHQTCPLLNVQSIDREILFSNPYDLLAWIKNLIDQDYYVQLDVDFFYLPDKPHFRRSHFIHEILVSGYEEGRNVFWTSGYDVRGRYITSPTPHQTLANSLSWNKDHHMQQAQNGKQLPHWFLAGMEDRPRIYLYKYHRDQTCLLDLACISELIEDYITGRSSTERHRLLTRPRPGGAWGINIYQALQEHIEELKENTASFSPIIWRILWEHKKCMLDRLCFLEDRKLLTDVLSTAWRDLVRRTNSLRLILLRQSQQKQFTATAQAKTLLASIAEDEYSLLTRLIRLL